MGMGAGFQGSQGNYRDQGRPIGCWGGTVEGPVLLPLGTVHSAQTARLERISPPGPVRWQRVPNEINVRSGETTVEPRTRRFWEGRFTSRRLCFVA